MSHQDPGPIPNRWLKCPRKANGLVAAKLLAFKTPLGHQFNEKVPEQFRFTPKMLFMYMKSSKVSIVIDFVSCFVFALFCITFLGETWNVD